MTTVGHPDSQDTAISVNGTSDQPDRVDQVTPEAESTAEVDYKALYEEEQKGRTKLEGDLKSTRGLLVSQQQRDNLMEDRFHAQERATLALARAVGSSSGVDDVSSEVSKIQAEATQTRGQAQFQSQSDSLFADLEDAVKDDDGNALLDLHQAPELADVRRAWNEGSEKGDIGMLSAALNSTHRIVRQVERASHKRAVSTAAKSERDKISKETEDTEALDLSLPAGAPASGMADDDFMLHRVGNPEHDLTREELQRAYGIRSKSGGF